MKNLLLALVSLAVGLFAGIASTLYFIFGGPVGTTVFTAAKPLHADGIEIPAGTELVLDRYMPEGFETLRLYINVEGGPLSIFSTRDDPRFNLVLPYWAEVDP